MPAAAVLAIEAGCDGVLICSGDHDTQAAALEALVHAVEDERLPLTRVEDALKRQQRAKERFLPPPSRRGRPPRRACASVARPRRAPGDRRRDGPLRRDAASRARSPLATASPSSRPPARSTARSSMPGIEEIRRLGFVPVYDDSVFARTSATWRAAGGSRRRDSQRPGAIRRLPA